MFHLVYWKQVFLNIYDFILDLFVIYNISNLLIMPYYLLTQIESQFCFVLYKQLKVGSHTSWFIIQHYSEYLTIKQNLYAGDDSCIKNCT